MRRGIIIVSVLLLLIGSLPMPVRAAAPNCSLCILEFQTQGQQGQEDQDFVIVANLSATKITASSIQLRYYNSAGVLSDVLGIGTFEVGQVKTYANDSLRELNSSATKLTLPLYSGGGSLQIARTSGATTTVYDKVGWGTANLFEGAPLSNLPAGATASRVVVDGLTQDSDNNALDFQVNPSTCTGVGISEVQPFSSDYNGQTIDAWIELVGSSTASGDCVLSTASGDSYTIPSEALPGDGEVVLIDQVTDDLGHVTPLNLGGAAGKIWLASASIYADVSDRALQLPYISQSYSNLIKGQSWALVDDVWRRTHQPTKGIVPNIFQASETAVVDDPAACETIRISELLPNPVGDDVGREWIELVNQSDTSVSLAHCVVTIAGVAYYFLPDDVLGPGEWRALTEGYTSEQESKAISLRNSGENSVMLQRLRADSSVETLQSFIYTDAPEGQSYARFADGWRWLAVSTPNLDNSVTPPTIDTGPTEFPVGNPQATDPDTGAPLVITELLPNPAAPQTDDADEFIELYNPTDDTVSLVDYVIQAGNSYSYSYTFTTETIPAGGYLIIKSGDTSVSLSNTAGRARLLGPNGQVITETIPYMDAPEGQSWALVDGVWQWTTTATPGTANILSAPVLAALSKASAKKATTNKTAKPKTAAKPKTKATKASAKKSTKSGSTAAAATTPASAAPPVHTLVLLTIGLAAIAYAIYEYRHDLANRLYRIRQRLGSK